MIPTSSEPPVVQQDDERRWLVQADHTASRDFDRAIMTLAAGALGISIAFIHNVASRPVQVAWLGAAWVLFSLSLLLILVSFLTSQLALRKEIAWIDSGRPEGDNTSGNAGRRTVTLNCLAALALIAGVGCLLVFALYNLEGR